MRRRYEIVFEAGHWTLGVGRLALRGFSSVGAAPGAAMESAYEAERDGSTSPSYCAGTRARHLGL